MIKWKLLLPNDKKGPIFVSIETYVHGTVLFNLFLNDCLVTLKQEKRINMSKAAFSLFVFGLYMVFVVGLGFMIAPHLVLSMFGLSAGDDVWIRMVGVLASIIVVYYILVVRARIEVFLKWTVPGRFFAAGFMVLMFVLGKSGPGIVLFAAVDAAAAAWTLLALRSDAEA